MRSSSQRIIALAINCFLFFNFLPVLASAQSNAAPGMVSQSRATTAIDIRQVDFDFRGRSVQVLLPDDMRAGDAVSGSVFETRNPGGATFNPTLIIDGREVPIEEGRFRFITPSTSIAIEMAMKSDVRDRIRTIIALRHPSTAKSSNFSLPTMGQTGRMVSIPGPFDGDIGTTSCNVGGIPAQIIAESPRQTIVRLPVEPVGRTTITLSEQGKTIAGEMRNVDVHLTAPKTNLVRGEQTSIKIEVRGLQGIRTEVPLSLNTTGVVNMDGGNQQRIAIKPSDVASNGAAAFDRTVTGFQAGNFSVVATVVVPISNLSGAVIHVEGSPNGGGGLWQIRVKMPDGSIKTIYLRSEQKPQLKFCDWIKIDDVTSEHGTIYVGAYTKVPPPKPPEPPKPPPAGPTGTEDEKPKPPGTTTKPPETTSQPPPCPEGATRIISSEKKTFEVMDGDPIFKVYTDKDGAGAAAQNMADFWRDIAEAGGLLDYLPEGTGAGAAAAGWLFEYLEKGADILDALAKGRLKNLGVSKVTAEVIIPTKKITAVCITYEICINGKWVTRKKLEQTEERSLFRASRSADKGGNDWEKVSDPSRPQFFDPERAEAWARDFFKDQANILKGSGTDYEDFVRNCK